MTVRFFSLLLAGIQRALPSGALEAAPDAESEQ